jgi:hypothetical protein
MFSKMHLLAIDCMEPFLFIVLTGHETYHNGRKSGNIEPGIHRNNLRNGNTSLRNWIPIFERAGVSKGRAS